MVKYLEKQSFSLRYLVGGVFKDLLEEKRIAGISKMLTI